MFTLEASEIHDPSVAVGTVLMVPFVITSGGAFMVALDLKDTKKVDLELYKKTDGVLCNTQGYRALGSRTSLYVFWRQGWGTGCVRQVKMLLDLVFS